MNPQPRPSLDADVAIVGYGPVGQTLAVLLAQRGWRVTVVERHEHAYARPRAVSFDDEVARLLATTGISEQLRSLSEPSQDYLWRNAAGDTLLHFRHKGNGPSGWPVASMFHQPALEDALDRQARTLPEIRVLRGHVAVAVDDAGDDATTLTVEGSDGTQTKLRCGWLVGCDGANSTTRELMGIPTDGDGFRHDWLIVDVVLDEPRVFTPDNVQVCDPSRPVTMVSGGPGRRRWEFMRLPGESLAELADPGLAWQLLAPYDIGPGNARIERHAVYTFQARWATQWRVGRVLLAGDAAHLMPPFAGQGLCAGIRDAANLAWKLDLVLAGTADSAVLDSYQAERMDHVRRAIELSVALGKVICISDPTEAAERDRTMAAHGGEPSSALDALPRPRLSAGLLRTDDGGRPRGGAGLLMPQGRVREGARAGLLDDVVGHGIRLLCSPGSSTAVSPERLRRFQAIGGRIVRLARPATPDDDAGSSETTDSNGTHLDALAELNAVAAVLRPDGYLFGTAAEPGDIDSLLSNLDSQLSATGRAPYPRT